MPLRAPLDRTRTCIQHTHTQGGLTHAPQIHSTRAARVPGLLGHRGALPALLVPPGPRRQARCAPALRPHLCRRRLAAFLSVQRSAPASGGGALPLPRSLDHPSPSPPARPPRVRAAAGFERVANALRLYARATTTPTAHRLGLAEIRCSRLDRQERPQAPHTQALTSAHVRACVRVNGRGRGGSFPFDTVIATALEGSNSDFLRALKFVRMLKLIRAVKVSHAYPFPKSLPNPICPSFAPLHVCAYASVRLCADECAPLRARARRHLFKESVILSLGGCACTHGFVCVSERGRACFASF